MGILYVSLSFRFLRELSLEGNQIRAFPKGFLKLNITNLQVSSNFLSRVFWRESCPVVVQVGRFLLCNNLLNFN